MSLQMKLMMPERATLNNIEAHPASRIVLKGVVDLAFLSAGLLGLKPGSAYAA